MRKLGPKVWLAIFGIVLALGMTCCQFRGSWSAGLIDKVLRNQPGVTFVTHSLSRDHGMVRTADFYAYVSPDVSVDQLSALTRAGADQIHESWVYGGLGANLHVERSAPSFPAQSGATMYLSFEPSKTTPEPPWQDWLKLAQGDYAYEITGSASPGDPWRSANTSLKVILRSYDHWGDPLGASEFAASVRRLIADFPESTANWHIVDADSNNAPSIRSSHGLPTPEQLTLWEALDRIAPTNGGFDLEPPRLSIDAVPTGPGEDRLLIDQLQLIKNWGLPMVYEVDDAHITVRPGGCSKDAQEPQPRSPADEALQARLRAQFESCPP